jgi:putative membrane protein
MTTEASPPRPPRPPGLPSDLGVVRTVLASDRTLMSWQRTALSMYSFAFALYKFLQGLAVEHKLANPDAPRQVGLVLAAMGAFSLAMGIAEYWSTVRDLNKLGRFRLFRPVLIIAFIMALAGVVLFVGILIRRA